MTAAVESRLGPFPLAAGVTARLIGIRCGFALAAAGYASMGLVDDPLGGGMIAAAVFAGLGEASAVVCAGVFIGQEAPREGRGVIFGTYGLSGSLGMICLTSLGGLLYDRIGPTAPFLMMGAVNALVVAALLSVKPRAPR